MYQVLYQVLKAVFFDELSLQLKIWYAIARDEIIQPQIWWYLVSNVAHKSTFVNVALHIIHTNILSNENAEWPNINQSHKWVSGRLCLFVVYFWLWQMIHQWRKKLIPINIWILQTTFTTERNETLIYLHSPSNDLFEPFKMNNLDNH